MKVALAERTQDRLRRLTGKLKRCPSDEERIALLTLKREKRWHDAFAPMLSVREQLAVELIYAIGQGERLFGVSGEEEPFYALVKRLATFNDFYEPIGGIIGYQVAALDLLYPTPIAQGSPVHYSDPQPIEIMGDTADRRAAIAEGLRRLPQMAEIYTVGGAGDRLGLCDKSGQPLPVGLLPFDGRTLLEGLLRDLDGRERLYERIYGERIYTPVVMMTSLENGNHEAIIELCDRRYWFGRPRDTFYLVTQPSVPVMDAEGNWIVRGELDLVTRPGGHGVLWKVMEEQGAFDWLGHRGRTRAWVRQINNPLAGLDCGLLALAGYGWLQKKRFGFATCPRLLGASEGMVVSFASGDQHGISNVEYTDFERHGIQDRPKERGGETSRYPANTNILFADLVTVRHVVRDHPLPGIMVNLSKKMRGKGGKTLVAGRLETTMQNIADYLTVPTGQELPTFLTYNERGKTISVAKQAAGDGEIRETPAGAFDDLQLAHRHLFEECSVAVEERAVLSLHPALGPLWSVVKQKVRGGRVTAGSEVRLDLIDLDWEETEVEGSLLVEGEGSVTLRGVRVRNRGLSEIQEEPIWKGQPTRVERAVLRVALGGELLIDEVELAGDLCIEVHAGERVIVTKDGMERHPLAGEAWKWRYGFDLNQRLQLSR